MNAAVQVVFGGVVVVCFVGGIVGLMISLLTAPPWMMSEKDFTELEKRYTRATDAEIHAKYLAKVQQNSDSNREFWKGTSFGQEKPPRTARVTVPKMTFREVVRYVLSKDV